MSRMSIIFLIFPDFKNSYSTQNVYVYHDRLIYSQFLAAGYRDAKKWAETVGSGTKTDNNF